MPTVIAAREFRVLKDLPFCYICGKSLNTNGRNRDHVPPSGCFSQDDRAHNPLILPTHVACNSRYKYDDERVGTYLWPLHGKTPKAGAPQLKHVIFNHQEGRIGAHTDVDLYGVVERWVRAFHAALYQVPLPQGTKFGTELPVDVVSPGDNPTTIILDNGRPRQRALWERTINANRATKTIDRLVAWNGKVEYECVWVLTQQHAYCVFWIDFYNWRRLARANGQPAKDCVGFYSLFHNEIPSQATLESQIVTDANPSRFLI